MTGARRLATRMILATLPVTAVCLAGAVSPPSASAAPLLTLTETWHAGAGTILNDAPCGVAMASPVLFNDGGTRGGSR